MRAIAVSLCGVLGLASASAAPRFELAETVVLQRGWTVVTYRDLDRDGRPDLLVATGDRRRLQIHERRGARFVAVASLTVPSHAFSFDTIGDVDRDGFPEVVLRGSRSGELYVVEATRDDAYQLRRFPIAPVPDPTCIVDSDGDGRLEIVASQPGFPSRIHRFEAVGPDRYEPLPVIDGVGGSVFLGCARDARPGALRLVFADTHFWRGVARGTYLTSRGRIGMWPRLGLWPTALGDTDGDGRAELIGRTPDGGLAIATIAPPGDPAPPRVVVRDPDGSCAAAPGDLDGDGRLELVCTPMIDGVARVVVRARRGSKLVTVWDARAVLPPGATPTRAWSTADGNGDGLADLLVTSGRASPLLYVLTSAR